MGFFGEIQLEWLYAFTGCKSALYSNRSLNHLMPKMICFPPPYVCYLCTGESCSHVLCSKSKGGC